MNAVIKVINRVIVVEFYRQNAAFFALIFLVSFGFIKFSEHIALGSFLVSNPPTLIYLFILWLAYAIKVVLFTLPTINKRENHFIEAFFLLPHAIKVISAFVSSFLLLLPILVYAIFLIFLALLDNNHVSAIILVLALIIFTVAISWLFYLKLSRLPHEKVFFRFKILKKYYTPSILFYIAYILRAEIVLLVFTKFYSCALIIGTTILYRTDQFDLRLLTTGVLLAFIGNVTLVHKYVWFQYRQMAFFRNLPITFIELFARHVFIFLVLLIPEFVTLLRYYPIEPRFMDLIGIVFFGVSILTLIYSLLLIKQGELSQFMTIIFWMVVFSTFLILFSVHPIILAVLFLLISATVIYFRHYQFEYIEK